MNRRTEIVRQLTPGLSADEWKRQGEELFLSSATGEQLETMTIEQPSVHRRATATILGEYVDNMKWLETQHPLGRSRKTRRGKRGGRQARR
jgi:hypothetical protein